MQVMTLPAEIKVSCALCYGALTNTKFANVTSVTDARAPSPITTVLTVRLKNENKRFPLFEMRNLKGEPA